MKFRHTRRGFTLIELLVVVLIIGILAAVALPQYQRVVHRAETAEVYVLMDTFDKAQAAYYLTHGTYEGISPETLDVELPTLKYFKYCRNANTPCDSGPQGTGSPFMPKGSNVGLGVRYQIGVRSKELVIQKAFGLGDGNKWMCYAVRSSSGKTDFDICSKYVDCDASVSGVSSGGITSRSCRVVKL